MAAAEGVKVTTAQPSRPVEVEGVNDRSQMARLERVLQSDIAESLMAQGVALRDPSRLDVRGSLKCGHDVEIDVGCIFEGDVELGEGVRVGPHCVIRDSHIGAETIIESHSVVEGAVVAGHNRLGPLLACVRGLAWRSAPGSAISSRPRMPRSAKAPRSTT